MDTDKIIIKGFAFRLKVSKTLGWAFVLHCTIEKSHVTAVVVTRHRRFFNDVRLALTGISDLSA